MREDRHRGRALLPTLTVAAIAALLQFILLAVGGGSGSPLAPTTRPSALDYTVQPFLAIPRLTASFIAEALTGEALGRASASDMDAAGVATSPSVGTRSESPPATPSPTSRPPIIPGTGEIVVSMTVDRTTASPGDLVTYRVVARNTGDAAVTTAFIINTHTPRFTLACTGSDDVVCTVPGDYDGASKDPNDPHVLPVQTETSRTIPPGEKVDIRTVRVRVVEETPSGTRLFNHAHVKVVGDAKPAGTYLAPDVVVP